MYKPVYLTFKGKNIEMQRNAALFEVFLNTRKLSFNHDNMKDNYILLDNLQIVRSFIHNLRSAIYRLCEGTEEYKNMKARLVHNL